MIAGKINYGCAPKAIETYYKGYVFSNASIPLCLYLSVQCSSLKNIGISCQINGISELFSVMVSAKSVFAFPVLIVDSNENLVESGVYPFSISLTSDMENIVN